MIKKKLESSSLQCRFSRKFNLSLFFSIEFDFGNKTKALFSKPSITFHSRNQTSSDLRRTSSIYAIKEKQPMKRLSSTINNQSARRASRARGPGSSWRYETKPDLALNMADSVLAVYFLLIACCKQFVPKQQSPRHQILVWPSHRNAVITR